MKKNIHTPVRVSTDFIKVCTYEEKKHVYFLNEYLVRIQV